MEILKSALRYRTRNALIVENTEYTYQTLLSSAVHVARQLEELFCDGRSISAKNSDWGPRVGLYLKPGFEYVAATWGTWLAGGIVVPLAASHTERELKHVIEDASIGIVGTNKDWRCNLPQSCEAKVHLLDKFMNADLSLSSILLPQENDGALIIYTSGTTGKPKGVLHTHKSLNAQMKSLSEAWQWNEDDCILHTLPLHHIHGIVNALYCAHFNGACVRILQKFSPAAVWSNLKSEKVSIFMAVPTMYSHLLSYFGRLSKEEQEELTVTAQKLRLYVSGSAACPVPLMMEWKDVTEHWLLERYGMTEIGMALSNPLIGERRPGHVGTPLPGVVVKVSSSDEASGELLVKGDVLFKEYWNLSEITDASFDAQGYFKTGDTVCLSGSPLYFKILGRTSVDIIKCGGYKLSALEIESVLHEDSRIKECCIVGIPDDIYGEIPTAVVVASEEESSKLMATQIIEFCASRLARYKVPREVVFVKQLPRNAMSKVNKKEIIKSIQNKSDCVLLTTTV